MLSLLQPGSEMLMPDILLYISSNNEQMSITWPGLMNPLFLLHMAAEFRTKASMKKVQSFSPWETLGPAIRGNNVP